MRPTVLSKPLFRFTLLGLALLVTAGGLPAQTAQIVDHANLEDGDLVSIGKKVVLTFEVETPLPASSACPLPGHAVSWVELDGTPAGQPVAFTCRYFQNLDGRVRLLIEPTGGLEHGRDYRVKFDPGAEEELYRRDLKTLDDKMTGRYVLPMTDPKNNHLSAEKDLKLDPFADLGFDLEYNVYLPPGYDLSGGQHYPVVFALHGLGNNFNIWGTTNESLDFNIQNGYVEPMVVIFPDGMVGWRGEPPDQTCISRNLNVPQGAGCQTHFHTTKKIGAIGVAVAANNDYSDFLSSVFQEKVREKYRIRGGTDYLGEYARRSTGIGGYSMGAYGALLNAFIHPETYGCVVALSPEGVALASWRNKFDAEDSCANIGCWNDCDNIWGRCEEIGESCKDDSHRAINFSSCLSRGERRLAPRLGDLSFWVDSERDREDEIWLDDLERHVGNNYAKVAPSGDYSFDGNIYLSVPVCDGKKTESVYHISSLNAMDLDCVLDRGAIPHTFKLHDYWWDSVHTGPYFGYHLRHGDFWRFFNAAFQEYPQAPGEWVEEGHTEILQSPQDSSAVESADAPRHLYFNDPCSHITGRSGLADNFLDPDKDGLVLPGSAGCEPARPVGGTYQDNCPDHHNPDQADRDCDGLGDACDEDPGRPPIDLTLVLDYSGSMSSPEACEKPPNEAKIDVLRQGVESLLNAWEPFAICGDRLGVMYFADDADPRATPLLENLVDTRQAVIDEVWGHPSGTYTALGPGVLSAADAFDDPGRKRHMVVISDGRQNVAPLIRSAGDVDEDGVEEHHVVAAEDPADARGGTSGTVLPRPNKYLESFGIPMNTLSIGSGSGTVHQELLAAVARETGGFHLDTCYPQQNLEEFLANSLVAALRGNTVELVGYETESIRHGDPPAGHRHHFAVNGSASRAVFMLSWSGGSGEAADLGLEVYPPEAEDPLPSAVFGTSGPTFHRVVVDLPLAQPGGSGEPSVEEWRMEVTRNLVGSEPIRYRAYLLVDDTELTHDFTIDPPIAVAGEPIAVRARVSEGGRALAPASIVVTVERPGAAAGTVIREAGVTDADRKAITELLGIRELEGSRLLQTYEAVFRDPQLAARLAPVSGQVPLFDDGRAEHGDAAAGDGLYSGLYLMTHTPGEHQLHVVVSGTSAIHGPYRREQTASATVVVRQTEDTELEVRVLDSIGEKERFQLLVTPMDRFGNYLGPGYADRIRVAIPGAEAEELRVDDLLDGTYLQTFRTADLDQVTRGELEIFGTTFEIPTEDLPGKPSRIPRRAWSLHAGRADPMGVLGRLFDAGPTVHLDRAEPLRPRLSWNLRLGISRFEGKSGQPDLDVWTLSANLEHTFWERGPWGLSVHGGGGLYAFDPGDLEGGYNLGLGVARELSTRLTLEATYDYCAMFTASPNVEYGQVQLGLLWFF